MEEIDGNSTLPPPGIGTKTEETLGPKNPRGLDLTVPSVPTCRDGDRDISSAYGTGNHSC